MENQRKSISQRTRVLVLARDNHKCRMCGRSADEVPLEVDHIFPHAYGGTDDLDNLATLCRDCNRGKSDLFLRSLLKQKVEQGDFTPIGEVILKVEYNRLKIGSKLHEYELSVEVFNDTSKTIANPQLEVVLPAPCIFVNSGGEIRRNGKMATIFFSKLDVDRIHPKQSTKLMTTTNVGLFYKMNDEIYWDESLMKSEFVLTMFGDDTQPTIFRKPFKEMQCF